MRKYRVIYFFIAVATIALGLSTRKIPSVFPPFVAEYGGDTLWALLFLLLFRMVWIKTPLWKLGTLTYLFTVLIECSQLYEATWIRQWRQTFAGKMILGQGFLWSDLACYATGILIGVAICAMVEKSG